MIKVTADIKRLGELIKDIKIAMLATLEPDGTVHSRPMATQRVDFDGALWFFTRAGSGSVEAIQRNPHVNVAYLKMEENRYVSVSGVAVVESDAARMQELWDPALLEFFPGGLGDPELALLRVSVEQADYWSSPAPGPVAAKTKPVVFNRGVMTSRATGKDTGAVAPPVPEGYPLRGHLAFPHIR